MDDGVGEDVVVVGGPALLSHQPSASALTLPSMSPPSPSPRSSSLTLVGEGCLHLICEFIRLGQGLHSLVVWPSLEEAPATHLSRLSRTCRALYFAVRNLPSVFDDQRIRTVTATVPRYTQLNDVAYWSQIGGITWFINDFVKLSQLPSHGVCDEALRQIVFHICRTNKNTHCVDKAGLDHVLATAFGLKIEYAVEHTYTPASFPHLKYVSMRPSSWLRLSTNEIAAVIDSERDVLNALTQRSDLIFSYLSNLRDANAFSHGDCLDFRACRDITDVSALGRAHTLMLSACTSVSDVSALRQVHSLDISEHRTLVAADFGDQPLAIHTLTLRLCDALSDATPFAGVHTLELISCFALEDVSMLGRVHTLDLSCCRRLTDVSALAKVHKLTLRQCRLLTDVSALGGVHTLDISNCDVLSDVSALGNVHTLSCMSTPHLTDVSALTNVHTLYLRSCSRLADVSALGNTHALYLSRCRSITNVSGLETVHTLDLSNCSNKAFMDVSPLARVKNLKLLSGALHATNLSCLCSISHLSIGGRVTLTKVGPYKHAHTLDLRNCTNLTDVSMLGHVHHLTLQNCFYLTNVSTLGGVHTLNLSSCPRVTDVSALGNVHTLNLSMCRKVTNLTGLGNNHALDVSNTKITDVSMLGNVHTLDISACSLITDLSPLATVQNLTLLHFAPIPGEEKLTNIPALKATESTLSHIFPPPTPQQHQQRQHTSSIPPPLG